jgi:hypothetical protein
MLQQAARRGCVIPGNAYGVLSLESRLTGRDGPRIEVDRVSELTCKHVHSLQSRTAQTRLAQLVKNY